MPTRRRERRPRAGLLVLTLTTGMAAPCFVASNAGADTTVSASSSNPLGPVLSEAEGQVAFLVDAVDNVGPFLHCLESYRGTPEPGCYEGPP